MAVFVPAPLQYLERTELKICMRIRYLNPIFMSLNNMGAMTTELFVSKLVLDVVELPIWAESFTRSQ